MTIVIIPGFTGYPEETTFGDLENILVSKGHEVIKVAWPNIPENIAEYNFTNTIEHCRKILKKLRSEELIILGFSMGGVIATKLASEFNPHKLGLITSPYQAGSEDDLEGKYKEWKETGTRKVNSSKYGELDIPFSFIEDARRYNALDLISNIKCPLLFVVGEKDTKVPPRVSRKIFDKANKPKEWYEISGMEHKYKNQPEKLNEVNEVIIKFIEQNS